MSKSRTHLPNDWYPGGIPSNVELAEHAYVESSDSFGVFHSRETCGLVLGEGAGAYVGASFMVGEHGVVTVGDFSVINGCSIICNERISIGAHCLIAWSSVITDTWLEDDVSLGPRQAAMQAVGRDPLRRLPVASLARPVTIEDNVWVGFGAVILPGVRLGRGSVIGCRSVVANDVEPYSVVVGDPPRVAKWLHADDTAAARNEALRDLTRQRPTPASPVLELCDSTLAAVGGA